MDVRGDSRTAMTSWVEKEQSPRYTYLISMHLGKRVAAKSKKNEILLCTYVCAAEGHFVSQRIGTN